MVLLLLTAVAAAGSAGAWAVYQYVATAPMRAQAAFEDGMRRRVLDDDKGAIERFTRAIDIRPGMAASYLQRGLALRDMNQLDAALEDVQSAIREGFDPGPAHTALGTIYRQRGDLKHAVDEFTVSLRFGASTDAYYQRGQVLESLGQHDQAIQDYDAAIQEQPDAPFVYRSRALARDAIGDHDGAEQDRHTAFDLEHVLSRRAPR